MCPVTWRACVYTYVCSVLILGSWEHLKISLHIECEIYHHLKNKYWCSKYNYKHHLLLELLINHSRLTWLDKIDFQGLTLNIFNLKVETGLFHYKWRQWVPNRVKNQTIFFPYLLIATFKLGWYVINIEKTKASHYQQPW